MSSQAGRRLNLSSFCGRQWHRHDRLWTAQTLQKR